MGLGRINIDVPVSTRVLMMVSPSNEGMYDAGLGFPYQRFWEQGFSRDLKKVSLGCDNPGLVIPKQHKFSHERKAHFHDSENPCLQREYRAKSSNRAQGWVDGCVDGCTDRDERIDGRMQ